MKSGERFFEETQWLRETRWIWFVAMLWCLITYIPVVYAVYWQLIAGQPVGNRPLSDQGLIILSIALPVMTIIFISIVRMIRLHVYVDGTGIHYNFFPSSRGWRQIHRTEILAYEVREKKNFFEHLRRLYSNNRITKIRSMTIHGSMIVCLGLKNRWKIMIGTQRPEDFNRALRRLTSTDQTF
jgi:hypothetical protein